MLVVLAVAALSLSASQDEDLETLLNRLEKPRAALRDVGARVTYVGPTTLRTGERTLRPAAAGTLAFRAPDLASWSMRPLGNSQFLWWGADRAAGLRAAISGHEILYHVPYALHRPPFGGAPEPDYPGGTTWFRSHLEDHVPPPMAMLPAQPQLAPVALLFDLAPKRFLRRLPSLKVGERRVEQGKVYWTLVAAPADPNPVLRAQEAGRLYPQAVWTGTEIWIDPEANLIDRMIFTHASSNQPKPVTWTREYRFEQRGTDGLPRLLRILGWLDERKMPWEARLEFSDVRVDAGVKEEDLVLRIPDGRLARDWHLQPAEVYDQDLENPAAWLAKAALARAKYETPAVVQAFDKVIQLRPRSEEGYAGRIATFGPPHTPDGIDVLEKALAAGVKSDLILWELAHRYASKKVQPQARRHFDALLAARGGADPDVLRAMLELGARDAVDRQDLALRAMRAEHAAGRLTGAFQVWKDGNPTDKDKQAMVRTLDDLVKKQDWMWGRLCLLELPGDPKKQAAATLALLTKGPGPLESAAVDRLCDYFRSVKDDASMDRLEKAFAGRNDDEARLLRMTVEAERIAATGDLERWLLYFDERLLGMQAETLATRGFDPQLQPGSRFFWRLQKDGRLYAFLERVLRAPAADPELGRRRAAAARSIGYTVLKDSDASKFGILIKTLEGGPAEGPQPLLNLVQQLILDKKWKEAVAHIDEIVKHPAATPDQRARAEGFRASVHEAAGEWEKAAAACLKALEEKGIVYRYRFHYTRARMFLELKDGARAAVALTSAFDEAQKEPAASLRWGSMNSLLKDMAYQLRKDPQRTILQEALEKSVVAVGGPAVHAAAGAARQLSGRHAEAAAAFDKAYAEWKEHPVLGRARVLAHVAAQQPEAALAARNEVVPVLKKEQANLSSHELKDVGSLNTAVAGACVKAKNLELAKTFARQLAVEPVTGETSGPLQILVPFIRDEKFIGEIDALLLKNATTEWERMYARFPGALAWVAMGKVEKAVAIYGEITEEKGWSTSYADVARAWIADWKKKAPGKP